MRSSAWLALVSALSLYACDLTGDLVYEDDGSSQGGGVTTNGGMGGTPGVGGSGGVGGAGGSVMMDGWLQRFGSDGIDRTGGLAFNGTNIIVAGDYTGTITVGGTDRNANGSEFDALVALLAPTDGAPDESNLPTLASPDHDSVAAVTTRAAGDVVIGGYFRDALALPTNPLSNGDNRDVGWIAQLDATLGNGAWSQPLVSNDFNGFVRVSYLETNDPTIYATGYFQEAITSTGANISFGSTGCSRDSIFVSAHDGDNLGTTTWMVGVGGTSGELRPVGLEVTSTHLFVAGQQTSSLFCVVAGGSASSFDFDPSFGANYSGDMGDIYVGVITLGASPSGSSFTIASTGDDDVGAIASDGDGVFVAGYMGADSSCGPNEDVGRGAFLCSFDAAGTVKDSFAFNSGSTAPQAMEIEGTKLYVAGNDSMLVDFGDGSPRSGIYVARFDVTGGVFTFEEVTYYDGSASITDMVLTASTMFLGGNLHGHIDLPVGFDHTAGASDIFVAALPR